MQADRSTDITRIVLFVLVIGILLAGSVWTLLPFLSGLIWATTIAVATWPTLLQVERLAGGRRWAAVLVMTVLVLLVFIVPFALAVSALLDAAYQSPTIINSFLTHGLGAPPILHRRRDAGVPAKSPTEDEWHEHRRRFRHGSMRTSIA